MTATAAQPVKLALAGKNHWTMATEAGKYSVCLTVMTRSHTVRNGIMSWQKYRAKSSTRIYRVSFLSKDAVATPDREGWVLVKAHNDSARTASFSMAGAKDSIARHMADPVANSLDPDTLI